MTPRQQRLLFVGIVLAGVSIATTLTLLAINDNLLYFYTPTQVHDGQAPAATQIRIGGLVVDGSVKRLDDGLSVHFTLTDMAHAVNIQYRGILPDLFREGQGIIAIGQLNDDNTLIAEQVLAKHDENYMPPEVAMALETAPKADPPTAGASAK